MQIKFTKNELEKLLELLSIADWVLTSMDVEEDERKDDYLKLLQKLYHEAYENGLTKEIEYDEDAKDYFLSEDWEEETQVRDFIEEYEDASFWEELTFRLADRDIDRKMNGKPPKNFEEHVAMFTKIQSKYEEEFEKNRLENLELISAKKDTKKAGTKKAAVKAAPAKKAAKPAPAKKVAPAKKAAVKKPAAKAPAKKAKK